MGWSLSRLWFAPIVVALGWGSGCSGGDPTAGFTAGNLTFGTGGNSGMSVEDSGRPVTTFDSSGTDAQSQGGSGGSGGPGGSGDSADSDPDSGDSDAGSADAGCVPSEEVCDGMDNDCDGTPDNGDPGGGELCSTGMPGLCDIGETVCEAGAIACVPVDRSVPELCDGEDNDCDGTVDNGNPEGGGACITGMSGVCGSGSEECQAGSLVCIPDETPTAEVCDGEDDDCDGAIDEGNPGGGGACTTGLLGVCADGTETCVGGMLSCQQDVIAAPAETCGNMLDDDCNGMVDDGCGGGSCPFSLCDGGTGLPQTPGCDSCVDAVCLADAFCCGTSWDALCVGQVETVCGRADCIDPACSHLVCDEGIALDIVCHPCVTSICIADVFCCGTMWDALCVNQVSSVCGLTCP